MAARGNHVTSFRSPAPATVEVPLPKRKRRERISVEEAKMGTTGRRLEDVWEMIEICEDVTVLVYLPV